MLLVSFFKFLFNPITVTIIIGICLFLIFYPFKKDQSNEKPIGRNKWMKLIVGAFLYLFIITASQSHLIFSYLEDQQIEFEEFFDISDDSNSSEMNMIIKNVIKEELEVTAEECRYQFGEINIGLYSSFTCDGKLVEVNYYKNDEVMRIRIKRIK